jgi:hypothetical protein
MRLININTTAFEEEDFLLLTDLNNDDLYEVIMPMVNAERDEEDEYDNEMIVEALKKRYPVNLVVMFNNVEQINY